MLVKIVLKPVYSDACPKEPPFRRCDYTIVSHVDLALRIGMTFSLALLWQCGTGVRVIN